MKMRLVTTTDGFVVALAPGKLTASGPNAPARVEPVPLHGQLVVDVDVSKELAKVPPSDLQRQYRYDARRKALVKFQPRQVRATPEGPAAPKAAAAEKAPARKKGK